MACVQLYLFTLSEVMSVPACTSKNKDSSVSNQFTTEGFPLEIVCNVSTFNRLDEINLYYISNDTIHNVTSKRTAYSVVADFKNVSNRKNDGWYCCCRGSCNEVDNVLGNVRVFIGESPPSDVDVECILKSDNTLFCTWNSSVDCVQWNVSYKYKIKSLSYVGDCIFNLTTCTNCPSSEACYVNSTKTESSFCRQCTIALPEGFQLKEYLILQFHGENLWGKTSFNKNIMTDKIKVMNEPILNLLVMTTTADSVTLSWILPIVPTWFDRIANITCVVQASSSINNTETDVYATTSSINVTTQMDQLFPVTFYNATVKCKLSSSHYWNPEAFIVFKTCSDKPLTGPELDNNSYLISNNTLVVYFKQMELPKARGVILGYLVKVKSSSGNTTIEYDAKDVSIKIPISDSTEYAVVQIYSKNIKGLSLVPSYINVNKVMINHNSESSVMLIAEKDRNSDVVLLTVYDSTGARTSGVSTLYWCRGERNEHGTVICKSDFHFTSSNEDLSIKVNNATEEIWHFGVAFENAHSGLIWERCTFNCRLCDASSIPAKPTLTVDRSDFLKLILTLVEDFCSQHQWIPFQYFISYYPLNDPSLAIKKTVNITPYLKTIVLDHIKENQTYEIVMRMASRTLQYGEPIAFSTWIPPSPSKDAGFSSMTTTIITVIIVILVISIISTVIM